MPVNKLQKEDLKNVSSNGDENNRCEDGVDITLIRWMLSMTPTERLQTLQQNVRSIMKLRDAKTQT